MQKEAKARILIKDLPHRSGWRFFYDENGPANIKLEAHVKSTNKILDDVGNDFEKTAGGYVDYLLLDGRGFPIAVLEAKSEKFDPLVEVTIPLPPITTQRQHATQLEAERELVESKQKLIEIFEAKIKAKLDEIWGEQNRSS